jgi:hypothetical protein
VYPHMVDLFYCFYGIYMGQTESGMCSETEFTKYDLLGHFESELLFVNLDGL